MTKKDHDKHLEQVIRLLHNRKHTYDDMLNILTSTLATVVYSAAKGDELRAIKLGETCVLDIAAKIIAINTARHKAQADA